MKYERQPDWLPAGRIDGDDMGKWARHAEEQKESVPFGKELQYGYGSPQDDRMVAWGIREKGGVGVDFGCGTALYRGFFKGMSYIGIDQNPNMLKIAQERWAGRESEMGNKPSRFYLTPLAQITDVYPELVSVADVGIFITVIQHNPVDTAVKVIQQAAKVLKPGGLVMLMEGTYNDRYFPPQDRQRHGMPVHVDPDSLNSVYGFGVFTAKGWLNFLNENGFENAEYDGTSYYFATRKG